MKSKPLLWDVSDVAEALKISTFTVRRWAQTKKLSSVKLGTRLLFDPQEVARFIERARRGSQRDAEVVPTA